MQEPSAGGAAVLPDVHSDGDRQGPLSMYRTYSTDYSVQSVPRYGGT